MADAKDLGNLVRPSSLRPQPKVAWARGIGAHEAVDDEPVGGHGDHRAGRETEVSGTRKHRQIHEMEPQSLGRRRRRPGATSPGAEAGIPPLGLREGSPPPGRRRRSAGRGLSASGSLVVLERQQVRDADEQARSDPERPRRAHDPPG